MKIDKICEKCGAGFRNSSFNHRTVCFNCKPKATHKYIKPSKEIQERNKNQKKSLNELPSENK